MAKMNKFYLMLILCSFQACLNPEEIETVDNPDMEKVDTLLRRNFREVVETVGEKRILLDGKKEINEVKLDTALLAKDLERILNIDFSKIISSTSYDLSQKANEYSYLRKTNENYGPIAVVVRKDQNEAISGLIVSFDESNFLYSSTREYELLFQDSKLIEYRIAGSQKIIGLDASVFETQTVIK
jgi:hypothetical protein